MEKCPACKGEKKTTITGGSPCICGGGGSATTTLLTPTESKRPLDAWGIGPSRARNARPEIGNFVNDI